MINQLNSYDYKIVANGATLDVYQDETIKISNNITELFDIGILSSEFTNDIALPGTKVNNEFFKHYYDFSIENQDSYLTNKKINCWIELNGIYIIEGYMVLNYVSLINNYVESYNITIYGSLSYFGNLINNKYLSDLTSLNVYDHYLTSVNISQSWSYQLFDGVIVYPFADYGQKIFYTSKVDGYGIDEQAGSLSVQDFKPSIKVKTVIDAIFSEQGYTYESNFLNSGYLDNAYLLLNKEKRYPKFDDIELENYGCFKIAPPKEVLNQPLVYNTPFKLPYYSIEFDNNNKLNKNTLFYTISENTKLRGKINLNFKLTKDTAGKGVPQFYISLSDGISLVYVTELLTINNFFKDLNQSLVSQNIDTPTQEYTLLCEFDTPYITAGNYEIFIYYTHYSANNFSITLDPSTSPESFLEVTKLVNVADGKMLEIVNQFPKMKQIDFIKSIQKKFNLIIYSSKTKLRHFIIETFNDWYKRNKVYDFNKIIDISSTIKITPANNLAYKELNFGDKLDNDYVSSQFKTANNREFGKEYYIDDENNYSKEALDVKTDIAFSQLVSVQNVGVSGETVAEEYYIDVTDSFAYEGMFNCRSTYNIHRKITLDVYSQYDLPYPYNGNTTNIGIKFKTTKNYYDIEDNPVNITVGYTTLIFKITNGKTQYEWDYLYLGSIQDESFNCYTIKYEVQCISILPSNLNVRAVSPIQVC